MSEEYSLESMFADTDEDMENALLNETKGDDIVTSQPQNITEKDTKVVDKKKDSSNQVDELLNPQKLSINKVSTNEATKIMYNKLNSSDQTMAVKVSGQLDFENRDTIMNYGAKVTGSIDNFAKNVLENADSETNQQNVSNNLEQISNVLKSANVKELLDENPEQTGSASKGGFLSNLFGHKETNKLVQGNKVDKFRNVSEKIDILKNQLAENQSKLSGDNDVLSKLYDQNLNFFKALSIYIAGAEVYNEKLLNEIIPELQQQFKNAGDGSLEGERLTRTREYQNSLEKKIYDLRLVRQVSLNQAPAIRLIQTNNRNLIDKIQSSITTALPTWRNNFVTVLATVHQRSIAKAQKDVADTTNDLLKQGADLLHQTTIETAKENERGVIEIETLQHVQDQLIASIDDTMKIQQEGSRARAESTQKLSMLENGLKNKLAEIATRGYEE